MKRMHRRISAEFSRGSLGFSILECVVALPIMAVFFIMAAQLFYSGWTMVHFSSAESAQVMERQMIIHRLRSDLRTCRHLQLVSRRRLVCDMPHGHILWYINPDGVVERTGNWQHKPLPRWRSEPVMKSAYFQLKPSDLLRLVYFVRHRHVVIAATPLVDLLPGGLK